jgi:hypothetical protein
VVRGADNGIQAEGAVALASMLKGNTTLQTLDLRGMWTARTRAFCRSWRPLAGTSRVRGRRGRERPLVVVGAACASAGSEHGVVRGADSGIEAEGAVALAAALQGNTTLQTLDLSGMWTSRTRAFCGNLLLCGERRYVRRSHACICWSGVHVWGPRESASGETRAAGLA